MTNLLVGDFIDFIFLKSFVVGIYLLATRADKALSHYHSTTTLHNLSFPFSQFCKVFVIAFIVNFSVADFLAVNALIISSFVLVPAKSFNNVRYFYLTAIGFFTSFWPTLAIYLSWIGKYYLFVVTYIFDGSIAFSRLLFRILTRIASAFATFCYFCKTFICERGFYA